MSDRPDTVDDTPRFNRDTRVRIALSKWYGMDGEEWSYDEIGEYLNVSERKVKEYVHESDMAEEMEAVLAEKEAQTRMKILGDLTEKLERLEEIEQQVQEEKKAVPSMFMPESTTAELDPSDIDGVKATEGGSRQIEIDIPVPTEYSEIPNVSKLSDVWREQRLVQEQIEELLGLESPDEIDVSSEKTVDVKHWELSGGDNLPDQEVIDIESSEPDADLPEGDIKNE